MLIVHEILLFQHAPEVTFSQQFIMYSFFIGTPMLLIGLIAYVGYKSLKQNKSSQKCPNCLEFVKENDDYCPKCREDLGEILE